MLAPLTAPHVDTRARDLSWALGVEALDALAVLPVEAPAEVAGRVGLSRLELRMLGASHQVIVTGPGGSCSETVACLPGQDGGLPGARVVELDGWTYSFTATVRDCSPRRFRDDVERLLRDVDGRADALAGRYPQSPHAVTAVVVDSFDGADPAGHRLGWRSWHTYPRVGQPGEQRREKQRRQEEGGEIVMTRTEVVAR